MELSALELLTDAPAENSANLSKLLVPEPTVEANLKPPTQRMNISVASMPNPSVLTDMISSVCGDIQRADEEEFLRQAVDETVLQRLVEAKLTITSMTGASAASAETLLAGVKWTLEMARENYAVTRFLGHCFLDIPLIDWIICANYVIGPCARLIVPTEKFSIFTHPDVELKVLNNEALVGSLMTSFAVIFWTVMCMFVKPNRLMFTVILIRVLIPLLLVMPKDHSGSMYVVHCGYNFITAGDIILIFFGFMGKAQGDMAKLAAVTGLLITLRQSVDAVSSKAASATVSAGGGVALAVWVLISIMGVLILWAPVSYHNFRLPSIWEQLKNLGKRRVLVFVGLATVADGIFTVLDETANRWFQLTADGNLGLSLAVHGLHVCGDFFPSVLISGHTVSDEPHHHLKRHDRHEGKSISAIDSDLHDVANRPQHRLSVDSLAVLRTGGDGHLANQEATAAQKQIDVPRSHTWSSAWAGKLGCVNFREQAQLFRQILFCLACVFPQLSLVACELHS